MTNVYTILWYKSEKPRQQLLDGTIFEYESDAKKALKNHIREIRKQNKFLDRKDGDVYLLLDKETEIEYTLEIAKLILI